MNQTVKIRISDEVLIVLDVKKGESGKILTGSQDFRYFPVKGTLEIPCTVQDKSEYGKIVSDLFDILLGKVPGSDLVLKRPHIKRDFEEFLRKFNTPEEAKSGIVKIIQEHNDGSEFGVDAINKEIPDIIFTEPVDDPISNIIDYVAKVAKKFWTTSWTK